MKLFKKSPKRLIEHAHGYVRENPVTLLGIVLASGFIGKSPEASSLNRRICVFREKLPYFNGLSSSKALLNILFKQKNQRGQYENL
jgi:hypothetical protein